MRKYGVEYCLKDKNRMFYVEIKNFDKIISVYINIVELNKL